MKLNEKATKTILKSKRMRLLLTAPLIFTALFSFYWSDTPQSLLEPIATLSVLIYNFALEPYKAQNELAWAASFILIILTYILV